MYNYNNFSNINILIVDDDYTLNESVKDILISNGFKKIYSAYSINEAISIFNFQNIELIILDVVLPDGDGYYFSKQVRIESKIPIIFLSSKNKPDDEILGITSGGDDYVTKPFLPSIFICRIFAILRRTYDSESEDIFIGNVKINIKNAYIIKNNQEIMLTPIELLIIKKLISNKNYIVSTESLCDYVWNSSKFGIENSLMVHIRNIRSKIEENPSDPKILVTIKGLGYKLIT